MRYELGDIEVHRLPREHFNVVISRFGTMFFADPVAAFRSIARAARPQAPLVMLVWQPHHRNEWSTALQTALGMDKTSSGADPFSLGDPATTHGILEAAGFADVGFEDVQEPVFYGSNVETAMAIVRSMRFVTDVLATLNSAAAAAVLTRLRSSLAAHLTDCGVEFDSRVARHRAPQAETVGPSTVALGHRRARVERGRAFAAARAMAGSGPPRCSLRPKLDCSAS